MSRAVIEATPQRSFIILDEDGLFKGSVPSLKEVLLLVEDHGQRYGSDLTVYEARSRFKFGPR